MKLIVCEFCDAEYQVKHNLNERYYVMQYCIFCGEPLSEELEDDIEEWDEDEQCKSKRAQITAMGER